MKKKYINPITENCACLPHELMISAGSMEDPVIRPRNSNYGNLGKYGSYKDEEAWDENDETHTWDKL